MKGPLERFLDEVKQQNRMVMALERDMVQIRFEVISLRSPEMGERVQTSRNKELSDAVIRMEIAKGKVGREIKRLICMRNAALRLIAKEPNLKLRFVLYRWYIMDDTMETISKDLNISDRHVRRMKREAIWHLEKMGAFS